MPGQALGVPLRVIVLALALLAALAGCRGAEEPRGAVATPGASPPAPGASPPAPAASSAPRPASSGSPRVLAALGDSITQAFLACGLPADCPQRSWATGSDPVVDSHASRLARADGVAPVVHLLAVSGARAEDLPRQARSAVAARADLVTVLIGANDACARPAATPVGDVEQAARRALDVLQEGRPQAQVLLLSVPDLGRLLRLGRGRPDVRRAWERSGVCPALLGDAADDDAAAAARRAAVLERLADYDRVLAATCRRHPTCTSDAGAVSRTEFALSFVSELDRFHPSPAGQRRLAEVSWSVAPWRR